MIDRQTWRGEMPITWVRQKFLGDAYDLVARFGFDLFTAAAIVHAAWR